MTLHKTYSASVFLLTALTVAGCGGGAQSPSMASVPRTMNAAQGGSVMPQDDQGCQTSDGIKVMPCRIRFDMNHPGPTNVRVTSDGNDRQRIKERDDCVSRNVATITKETMHLYSVAAGGVSGSCTAHFTVGIRNNDGSGGSDLIIKNRL